MFSLLTALRVQQLYIITLHLFSPASCRPVASDSSRRAGQRRSDLSAARTMASGVLSTRWSLALACRTCLSACLTPACASPPASPRVRSFCTVSRRPHGAARAADSAARPALPLTLPLRPARRRSAGAKGNSFGDR
jgi:hypothetical protein